LDESQLDALIEHSAECAYHQELLDHEEADFLSKYKGAQELVCIVGMGGLGKATFNTLNTLLDENDLSGDSTHAEILEQQYTAYRHWCKERCPIEILQIRGGGSVSVFEVGIGGVWKVRFGSGTSVVQLWTLCREHGDEVLLAAYPLSSVVEHSKPSTVSFPNKQTVYLSATVDEAGDYELFVGCTSSCVPPLASYAQKVSNLSLPYETFSAWREFIPNLAYCHLDSLADVSVTNRLMLSPVKNESVFGFRKNRDYGKLPIFSWIETERKSRFWQSQKQLLGFTKSVYFHPERRLDTFRKDVWIPTIMVMGSSLYVVQMTSKMLAQHDAMTSDVQICSEAFDDFAERFTQYRGGTVRRKVENEWAAKCVGIGSVARDTITHLYRPFEEFGNYEESAWRSWGCEPFGQMGTSHLKLAHLIEELCFFHLFLRFMQHGTQGYSRESDDLFLRLHRCLGVLDAVYPNAIQVGVAEPKQNTEMKSPNSLELARSPERFDLQTYLIDRLY
jgi:hypothetical protein